ncbi:hypothetical protein SK128_002235 [Halocaridina rubra]|uniref:Alpha-1,3-mannosyl-glycoprotein 2-beta-N-acetylglucosaminyltransferase n=1 Tax=Halocaridina rubra TaxID=373956 RepID=A0AAN8XK76_HALRR
MDVEQHMDPLRTESSNHKSNATRDFVYSPGLHFYIFNQRTGRLLLERDFKTIDAFSWWADLIWWLQQTSPGRLVLVTVSGFGNTVGLRRARMFFLYLGSVFARYLGITSSWTWAFIKGGRTIYENFSKGYQNRKELYELEQCSDIVNAEGIIELSVAPLPASKNYFDQERWAYCNHEGGMGELCDEYAQTPLPKLILQNSRAFLSSAAAVDIRVILAAGKRHQYLYKTLWTLMATPGAKQENIFVILGDNEPPTIALLHLLGLNYTIFSLEGQGNSKLFQFYRNVYQFINSTFSDTPAVVILDEDVELSPDFFHFVGETYWLLLQDPTLYCINGFSLLPNYERGRGEHYVRRGAMQVSWGYVVTLDFIREALQLWPKISDGVDILIYDYWIYDKVRGDRECVYPEISRIRHYGMGTNTESFMHEYEAWYRPLLNASQVNIKNAVNMLSFNHERELVCDLKRAITLGPVDPCGHDFIAKVKSTQVPYIMYYSQEQEDDISSWYILGQCVGLHAVSEQGNHNGAYFAYIPSQKMQLSLNSSDSSINSSSAYDMKLSWHPRYPPNYKPPLHFPPDPTDAYGLNYYTPKKGKMSKASVLVYFIGVPYSKYSYLKAKDAFVYNASTLTDRDVELYGNMFQYTMDILMLDASVYTFENLIKNMFRSKT